MHRLVVLALITAVVVSSSLVWAENYATSHAQLEAAYERLHITVQDVNRGARFESIGAFVFCVCAGNRGRIIYRTGTMRSESTIGMHVDWLRQAAEKGKSCGGCYMDPTVRIVRP